MKRILLPALAILLGAHLAALYAVERFPPPDFTSGYHLPSPSTPMPRATGFDYLDVFALVAALSAAAYLGVKARSRSGLIVLSLASLAYFGFYRQGCICPIGAIQNVTMGLFDSGYAVPGVVLAFFLIPLAFAVFFGRVFCSAVCPLGAIQDVMLLRPVATPSWLEHALGLGAWLYLGAAVTFAALGSAFIICRYDPFVSMFRLEGNWTMLAFGACVLVLGMFIGRPYCRYACPYGAILRLLSSVSHRHMTITPDECINCRLCEESCPFGAIRKPTPAAPPVPRKYGRWTLAAMLAVTPVLAAACGYAGYRLSAPMAGLDYRVKLARQIQLEDAHVVAAGVAENSTAYRDGGKPIAELYAQAAAIEKGYDRGGAAMGGFMGLVIGLKLVRLSIRRRRPFYEIHRATCVSCGRCMPYCPFHQKRLKEKLA